MLNSHGHSSLSYMLLLCVSRHMYLLHADRVRPAAFASQAAHTRCMLIPCAHTSLSTTAAHAHRIRILHMHAARWPCTHMLHMLVSQAAERRRCDADLCLRAALLHLNQRQVAPPTWSSL